MVLAGLALYPFGGRSLLSRVGLQRKPSLSLGLRWAFLISAVAFVQVLLLNVSQNDLTYTGEYALLPSHSQLIYLFEVAGLGWANNVVGDGSSSALFGGGASEIAKWFAVLFASNMGLFFALRSRSGRGLLRAAWDAFRLGLGELFAFSALIVVFCSSYDAAPVTELLRGTSLAWLSNADLFYVLLPVSLAPGLSSLLLERWRVPL